MLLPPLAEIRHLPKHLTETVTDTDSETYCPGPMCYVLPDYSHPVQQGQGD